ncbi:uncharacterized protein FYN12_001259 [Phoenicopterus ruber ruber]
MMWCDFLRAMSGSQQMKEKTHGTQAWMALLTSSACQKVPVCRGSNDSSKERLHPRVEKASQHQANVVSTCAKKALSERNLCASWYAKHDWKSNCPKRSCCKGAQR